MNWLFSIITFAFGMSLSAVLFLGWYVLRLHRRDEQRPILPGEAGQSHSRHSEVSGESESGPNIVAPQAHARQMATQVGFENPRISFQRAFMTGDIKAATVLLPKLEELLGRKSREFLLSASSLAIAGRREALPYLLNAIQSGEGLDDEQFFQGLVASAVQYYASTDRETEGLDALEEVIRKHAYDESRSEDSRAYLANQLQMLYYGSSRSDDALTTIQYVIELSPRDSSYYFNKSLILEQREELRDAVEAIEKCVELGTDDDDNERYLRKALDLYQKLGDLKNIEVTEKALRDLVSS